MFIHDVGVRHFTWDYDKISHRSNLPGEAYFGTEFQGLPPCYRSHGPVYIGASVR